MIAAIPTRYKGVQMRSRLKARWAAFFDLLDWRWEYEPFDRNGWIPDFALLGAKTVLVEVKPINDFRCLLARETAIEVSNNIQGFEEGLIVSWFLPEIELEPYKDICIGWLDDGECGFEEAAFGHWTDAENLGFCHSVGSFRDRISGNYDGGCHGDGKLFHQVNDIVRTKWTQAGNIVQWKAPT